MKQSMGLMVRTLVVLIFVAALTMGVAVAESVSINATNFPDEEFRQFVLNNYDENKDKSLSDAEIAKVTTMDCSKKGIYSLKGIENFTALTALNCSGNRVRSLNVSNMKNLNTLNCDGNSIETLNLKNNTKLQKLYCNENHLVALDLSANSSLIEFEGYMNTRAVALTSGSIVLSNFSEINTSKIYEVDGGKLSSGKLTPEDADTDTVSYSYKHGCSNTDLDPLEVFMEIHSYASRSPVPLNKSTFPDAKFREFLSKDYDEDDDGYLSGWEVAEIVELICPGEGISDLTGISHFFKMTGLYCEENQITSLDLSGNTGLLEVTCNDNQLKSLNVSKNTALLSLDCSGNQLTTLDVSKNTALTDLSCGRNHLVAMSLANNTALESFDGDDNSREITLTNGVYPISSLSGVTASKITGCNGFEIVNRQIVPYPGLSEISYDYDCGQEQSMEVILVIAGGDSIIQLPDNLTFIEAEAFAGIKATTFILPSEIGSIGANAFPANALLYYPAGSITETYMKKHASDYPNARAY